MLWRIIIHEWRGLRADHTLWLLTGVFVFLASYGIYNGNRWARSQQETTAQLALRTQQQLDQLRLQLAARQPLGQGFGAIDPASPFAVSTQQWNVVLSPAPLAALSVGQSDLYPNTSKVYSWSFPGSLFSKTEPQNPVNLQIGRFDLAFVIVYLFPLLVLAFSYNLLSAEQEEGTLALLLSQPVTLGQVVLGKALARALVIVALLVICALIGALIVESKALSLENGFRLLLWLLLTASYGLIWLALAVLINLWRRS